MPAFLHVGCGSQSKAGTTRGFNTDDWIEIRLDIDPGARPDIIGSLTDLSAIDSGSMDALYSSHNFEHLYPHEAPVALAEFLRVLKDDGFLVITCPDLKSVAALVAEDKLDEPAYVSPAGPIAPLDILYGLRTDMARGNLFMAHRSGYTEKTLRAALEGAGFQSVASITRPQHFVLWAVASKSKQSNERMLELARAHF